MRVWCFAAVAAVLALPAARAGAQQAPAPAAEPDHPGKVILSRSVEDSGSGPVAAAPTAKAAEAASDAERQAITFLSYDLDVHLQPREHSMAVRARVLVRNDSDRPLRRLPLQISSTLQWTGVRVADAPAAFSQQLVDSDIDHTGALREALISLAQPLAPQQSLALDLSYEGPSRFPPTGWSRSVPRRRWRKHPTGIGSPKSLSG